MTLVGVPHFSLAILPSEQGLKHSVVKKVLREESVSCNTSIRTRIETESLYDSHETLRDLLQYFHQNKD